MAMICKLYLCLVIFGFCSKNTIASNIQVCKDKRLHLKYPGDKTTVEMSKNVTKNDPLECKLEVTINSSLDVFLKVLEFEFNQERCALGKEWLQIPKLDIKNCSKPTQTDYHKSNISKIDIHFNYKPDNKSSIPSFQIVIRVQSPQTRRSSLPPTLSYSNLPSAPRHSVLPPASTNRIGKDTLTTATPVWIYIVIAVSCLISAVILVIIIRVVVIWYMRRRSEQKTTQYDDADNGRAGMVTRKTSKTEFNQNPRQDVKERDPKPSGVEVNQNLCENASYENLKSAMFEEKYNKKEDSELDDYCDLDDLDAIVTNSEKSDQHNHMTKGDEDVQISHENAREKESKKEERSKTKVDDYAEVVPFHTELVENDIYE